MDIRKIYGFLLMTLAKLAGSDAAKKFDTGLRFHRRLDLRQPRSLADKASWIELHHQSPLAPQCTDKYAVRQYVADKGLADILIPLAGGPWDRPEDIDFDALPDSFVLKATHGCKMNYPVPDKSRLDDTDCRKTAARWLGVSYGSYSMELHYLQIPHRLYAECYLERPDSLVDYKIHCIHGEPAFILVCRNRQTAEDGKMSLTLDLMDPQWNRLEGLCGYGAETVGTGPLEPPEQLEQMKQVARTLSADFDFVRVDLYEQQGRVLFGELTFSPGCCVFPYFTPEFLDRMGEKLQLPQC